MNVTIRINTLLVLVFTTFSSSQNLYASEQAVAIDYLHGEQDLAGIRLAYRPHHTNLAQFEWLGNLDVYWELSLNFWEFGEENKHETNYALALSPLNNLTPCMASIR